MNARQQAFVKRYTRRGDMMVSIRKYDDQEPMTVGSTLVSNFNISVSKHWLTDYALSIIVGCTALTTKKWRRDGREIIDDHFGSVVRQWENEVAVYGSKTYDRSTQTWRPSREQKMLRRFKPKGVSTERAQASYQRALYAALLVLCDRVDAYAAREKRRERQ